MPRAHLHEREDSRDALARFLPSTRPVLAVVAGCLACLGCGPRNARPVAGRTGDVAASVVEAPAPPPPRPGSADLTFTGAFVHAVAGTGVDDPVVPGEFDVTSADLDDTAAGEWFLAGHDADGDGPAPFTVVLGVGRRHFTWRPDGWDDGTELARADGHVSLSLHLTDPETAEVVRLDGTIELPSRATENQVPEAVVRLLGEESGAPVRLFSTYDFGRARDPLSISVLVSQHGARDLVRRLSARLGRGWIAFVGTTQWLGEEHVDGAEVVVGPGETSLDALRLARSNAVNYGMGTESLVRRLARWDQRLGVVVWRAETDTVGLDLRTLPSDLRAFAEEVHAFCPDLVDQVLGSVEALERAIAADRALTLWWD